MKNLSFQSAFNVFPVLPATTRTKKTVRPLSWCVCIVRIGIWNWIKSLKNDPFRNDVSFATRPCIPLHWTRNRPMKSCTPLWILTTVPIPVVTWDAFTKDLIWTSWIICRINVNIERSGVVNVLLNISMCLRKCTK